MKVLDIGTVSSDTQSSLPVKNKQCEIGRGHGFHRQMTAVNEDAHRLYITELQNRIVHQGDILRQKADIAELQKYRSLITDLFNETVSNSYECSSKNSLDSRGRHKIYVVIRRVNNKLDDMKKEILSGQADNLKLLEMVDDIRGLLVDLFL